MPARKGALLCEPERPTAVSLEGKSRCDGLPEAMSARRLSASSQPMGLERCLSLSGYVSLPLSNHLSSALAKRCLSAALKGAGPPVWTPAERSSSMKLRMPSRACMVSRV